MDEYKKGEESKKSIKQFVNLFLEFLNSICFLFSDFFLPSLVLFCCLAAFLPGNKMAERIQYFIYNLYFF